MTLLVDRPASETPAPPEPRQGVIEEARRRERARRLRRLSIALAAAGIAALAAGLLLAHGDAGAPAGPLHIPPEPATPVAPDLHGARDSVLVRVSPNLTGAEAGWCIREIFRTDITGGCAPLPTATTLVISDGTSWGSGERDDTTVAVTAPNVRTVEFSDGARRPALTEPGLPYGMRVAVLRTPHNPDLNTLIRSVAAFDAGGRRMTEARVRGSGLEWRIWNPPSAPSKGACSLTLTGGYHATTEWGQVAGALRPYPAEIDGRGFLSCIDTEYYVPGRGMRASVLLDAHAPARTPPAAIGGLVPLPGLHGYFESTSEYGSEPLDARREGKAWLVVAGGGRGAQEARVRLLEHLRVAIQD